MKTNEDLHRDISDTLGQHKYFHDNKIEIHVNDGIVTLGGTVDCHFKISEAEEAVKAVEGVKAVILEISIASLDDPIPDTKVHDMIVSAFRGHWDIPDNKLNVAVANGCVTLTGELTWNYQKEAAIQTASNLKGVKGILDNITIESDASKGLNP